MTTETAKVEKVEKAPKVTPRTILQDELAEILKAKEGLDKIARTSEGLVVPREGAEPIVVRVIQKKATVEAKDIKEWL